MSVQSIELANFLRSLLGIQSVGTGMTHGIQGAPGWDSTRPARAPDSKSTPRPLFAGLQVSSPSHGVQEGSCAVMTSLRPQSAHVERWHGASSVVLKLDGNRCPKIRSTRGTKESSLNSVLTACLLLVGFCYPQDADLAREA